MENGVKITGAKEGKFGTEPNAFVRLDIISMVFYVYYVEMDSNGIQGPEHDFPKDFVWNNNYFERKVK